MTHYTTRARNKAYRETRDAPPAHAKRITTVTARHRSTGELEYYRCRDTLATREDVIARCGVFLGSLGWKPQHVCITSVHTELESAETQKVRNRMIEPRS